MQYQQIESAEVYYWTANARWYDRRCRKSQLESFRRKRIPAEFHQMKVVKMTSERATGQCQISNHEKWLARMWKNFNHNAHENSHKYMRYLCSSANDTLCCDRRQIPYENHRDNRKSIAEARFSYSYQRFGRTSHTGFEPNSYTNGWKKKALDWPWQTIIHHWTAQSQPQMLFYNGKTSTERTPL